MIAQVVEETATDVEAAYHELGVLPEGGQIETLSFSALATRVSEQTGETATVDGINRWAGELTEFNVMRPTGVWAEVRWGWGSCPGSWRSGEYSPA